MLPFAADTTAGAAARATAAAVEKRILVSLGGYSRIEERVSVGSVGRGAKRVTKG